MGTVRQLRLLALFFTSLFASGALGAAPAGSADPSKSPYVEYLTILSPADMPAVVKGIVSPAAGSAADHNDMLEVRRRQARRKPADCERVMREASISVRSFWVDSKILTADQGKLLEPLLSQVSSEVDVPVWILKERFKRLRPHFRKNGSKPCAGLPPSYNPGHSFPSGHAAIAYAQGLALSELFPARRREIMEQANSIGTGRIILGVHHPSDVRAGREIARRTMKRALKSPEFKKLLLQTKANLSGAGAGAATAPVTSGDAR